MSFYEFIFSNRPANRLVRHSIFWSVFLFYFFYINLLPGSARDLIKSKTYLNSLELMIYIPVSILAVYVALNILLPVFIYKGKYLILAFVITGATVLYFFLAFLITMVFAALTHSVPYHELPISFRWFLPVRYGIGFPVTSTILVCIFKLFKNFHLEQKQNEKLLREKINTELQLLKTKFQPGFLYEALQHILYLVRIQSSESSTSLLRLSDLLSYVLYEQAKDIVPLEKELEIVQSFIILKKTFYPEILKVQFDQQIQTPDLFISPLLLLSIVENCLDGLEQNTGNRIFMKLNIKTVGKELHFQLECNRNAAHNLNSSEPDIKLLNSLRRIELLYARRNSLDLSTENGTIYLMLILTMHEYSITNNPITEMPAMI